MKFTRSMIQQIPCTWSIPESRHVSYPKNGDLQRSAGEGSQTLEFKREGRSVSYLNYLTKSALCTLEMIYWWGFNDAFHRLGLFQKAFKLTAPDDGLEGDLGKCIMVTLKLHRLALVLSCTHETKWRVNAGGEGPGNEAMLQCTLPHSQASLLRNTNTRAELGIFSHMSMKSSKKGQNFRTERWHFVCAVHLTIHSRLVV